MFRGSWKHARERGRDNAHSNPMKHADAPDDLLLHVPRVTHSVACQLPHQIPYDVHVVIITDNANSSHVVDTVIDVAKKIDAAMVVVGTHGRSPVPEMLLGSVASGLLKQSPINIVVVRPTA